MSAIDFLQELKKTQTGKYAQEWLNEAIQALKQKPCDDCVSREEAIMCLTGINLPTDIDELIALYNERLKALPPVLPKREQGEWCEQNDDYFDWYECSECGYGSEGEMQYSSEYDVRTKYCPNCGAEMR